MNSPLSGVNVISYTRYSATYTPSGCQPLGILPCYPNKCASFSPLDHSEVRIDEPPSSKLGVNFFDIIYDSQNGLSIIQNDIDNSLNISINSDNKGDVSIKIYGLLGNLISTNEYYKDGKIFNQTLTTDLHSGMYFCTVKLNNQVIGSKKIIIVK
jgi:hypothetical protein